MSPGLLILLFAVLAAVAFGLHRRRVDGRFARAGASPAAVVTDTTWASVAAAVPDARLGERATLVQFSSAFCAPCRTTRTLLADVAGRLDGVTHVEVDAEAHLDLVRDLDIRRTPTTLILDPSGAEHGRAAGAPRREQVLAALPSTEKESR